MKPVTILRILFLASQVFLASGHKTTEWPDEGDMKWNVDLNDMIRFKKSFLYRDAKEESKEEQETIPLEYQLESLSEQLELIKKLHKLQNQSKQYIKRYINLFLVKCSLQNVPESEEDLNVNLEFSITKEDLIFLQNLSKEIGLQNVQDNLYRLDKIFDKGLRVKEKSNFSEYWQYMSPVSQLLTIPSSWYKSKLFYYVVVLTMTLALAVWFKCCDMSNLIIVLTIINNLILLEGLLNYLNQLKEAETIDHVRTLKAMYPDACDPKKETIWSKIIGWFTGDDCLNYHMSFIKSASQVSPLKCILDAYNVYLFQYIVKVVGSCFRVFTENLYDGMPLQSIWIIFSYIYYIPTILILILILLRPSIRLSFFGTGISIGFPQRSLTHPRNEEEPIQYQRLQEIQASQERNMAGERTEREPENDSQTKGEAANHSTCDPPVERIGEQSHSKVVEGERSVDGSNRTLLEDITTARNIVKDIKKSE